MDHVGELRDLRPGSATIGRLSGVPVTSPMSGAHGCWCSTGSTDSATALVLRFANSPRSAAVRPSSVVHTGVKSIRADDAGRDVIGPTARIYSARAIGRSSDRPPDVVRVGSL